MRSSRVTQWTLVGLSGLLGVIVLGTVLLLRNPGQTHHSAQTYAVLYKQGRHNLFLSTEAFTMQVSEKESQQQRFHATQKLCYYDEVTEDGLAVSWLSFEKKEQTTGRIAERAKAWRMLNGGTALLYLEKSGGRLFVYDAAQRTASLVAENVQEFFCTEQRAPKNTFPVVWFTRREQGELGAWPVIFRTLIGSGKQPERMTGPVTALHFVHSPESGSAELYFLALTGHDSAALCRLGRQGFVETLAKDLTEQEVFWEGFRSGGNVYYTHAQHTEEVPVVLEDTESDSDAALTEPQPPHQTPNTGRLEGIFEGLIGIFDGGRAAEEQRQAQQAYTKAKLAYQAKLERDVVRGLVPAYLVTRDDRTECSVVRPEGHVFMTEGFVSLLAQHETGRPAVVYQKRPRQELASVAVTLEELVMAYRAGGAVLVKETVQALLVDERGDTETVLSMLQGDHVTELPLQLEDQTRGRWFFFGEHLLRAESDVHGGREALYVWDLLEYGLSERRVLDTGMRQAALHEGKLYYLKSEETRSVLYAYDGTSSTRLRYDVETMPMFGAGGRLYWRGALEGAAGTLYTALGKELVEIASGVTELLQVG